MFRILLLFLSSVVCLCGCASRQISRFDEFEKVRVDRTAGNSLSRKVLQKTIVCLDAMRESRWPAPVTNVSVAYSTNFTTLSFTNATVTSSSNVQVASATNALAAPPLGAGTASEVTADTNAAAAVFAPANNALGGGLTVSTTRNQSVASGPNQMVSSGGLQIVSSRNVQGTITTNNFSLTTATNLIETTETNYVVTTITNPVVVAVTNLTVASPDHPVADYYLVTEITLPPDFVLQLGESLVLLIDGARYSFAAVTPQSAWSSRRGFTTTFYKVPGEVLVAIANAGEVRLRIKGASATLERKMNQASRQHFREFLLKYFAAESDEPRQEPARKPRA